MEAVQTTTYRGFFRMPTYRQGARSASSDTGQYKQIGDKPLVQEHSIKGSYRGNNFKGRGQGNNTHTSNKNNKQ